MASATSGGVGEGGVPAHMPRLAKHERGVTLPGQLHSRDARHRGGVERCDVGQGAIVSGVTSQPASMPPGSIWPLSSPTSVSISLLSFSFIASTRSRCLP